MEPIKDKPKVARMFSQGQTSLVDTSSGYRYTMVACCPQDDSFSSVAQTEKTSTGLSRVVFRCPQCSALFAAKPKDIYIR
jgi:hypothetical protein